MPIIFPSSAGLIFPVPVNPADPSGSGSFDAGLDAARIEPREGLTDETAYKPLAKVVLVPLPTPCQPCGFGDYRYNALCNRWTLYLLELRTITPVTNEATAPVVEILLRQSLRCIPVNRRRFQWTVPDTTSTPAQPQMLLAFSGPVLGDALEIFGRVLNGPNDNPQPLDALFVVGFDRQSGDVEVTVPGPFVVVIPP